MGPWCSDHQGTLVSFPWPYTRTLALEMVMHMRRIALLLVVGMGCGGSTTVEAVGEAGLLVYQTTVFHGPTQPDSWSDAHFALHETYAVAISLTDLGVASLSEPAAVSHQLYASQDYVEPGRDTEQAGLLELYSSGDSRDVPDLDLTPLKAGSLWLEAHSAAGVVDVVRLQVVAGHLEVADGVVYEPEDGRW